MILRPVAKSGSFIIGFGRRKKTLNDILPNHSCWMKLHQIHSDQVVYRSLATAATTAESSHEPQADAHFTFDSGVGLVVKTADCLPIMIGGEGFAAAIHAGWRGVENGIVGKTLHAVLKQKPSTPESAIRVWIGPHIRQPSFEVDADVAERLQVTAEKAVKTAAQIHLQELGRYPIDSIVLSRPGSAKRWVDLETIVRLQLLEFGICRSQVESVAEDTFVNSSLSSFRRDRENAGRNLSFIIPTF